MRRGILHTRPIFCKPNLPPPKLGNTLFSANRKMRHPRLLVENHTGKASGVFIGTTDARRRGRGGQYPSCTLQHSACLPEFAFCPLAMCHLIPSASLLGPTNAAAPVEKGQERRSRQKQVALAKELLETSDRLVSTYQPKATISLRGRHDRRR
jgi:hypothetical protein